MGTTDEIQHRSLVNALEHSTAQLQSAGIDTQFGFEYAPQEEEFLAAARALVAELVVQLRVRGQDLTDIGTRIDQAFVTAGGGLPDTSVACTCSHSPSWHTRKLCLGKATTRDGEDDCGCSKRTAFTADQRRTITPSAALGADESF